MSSSSPGFDFSSWESVTEPRKEIVSSVAHNDVVKLTVANLLKVVRGFVLLVFKLLLIHLNLLCSVIEVIKEQVQIFFMINLHHVLVNWQVVLCIDLEFYFVFAMLVMISGRLVV